MNIIKFISFVFIVWWILSVSDRFFPSLIYSARYYNTSRLNESLLVEMPRTKPLKKNVYVFLSMNYTTLPQFAKYSMAVTRAYCERHEYEFLVFDHTQQHTKTVIPPYWIRVHDMIRLCNEVPENSLILYLDADATINPKFFDATLEHLVDEIDILTGQKGDFYIGSDPPNLIPGCNERVVNTGVILLRNTRWSRSFLQTWWGKFDLERWIVNDVGKWSCQTEAGTKCVWAQDNYEQGELNKLLSKHPLLLNKITIIHWSVFASGGDGLFVHLMGRSDSDRVNKFNLYYQIISQSSEL
jgi:hypothetical protein